jgi:AraC-like DNA-binding protein
MQVSLIAILYLLGAAQGIFLAIALLLNKATFIANRYLATLTILFCLNLITYFLDVAELDRQYLWLYVLLWPKEFFYGVLVYFYVRELTSPQKFSLKGRQWLHFCPGIMHTLFTWSLFLFEPHIQYAILEGDIGLAPPYSLYVWLLGDIEISSSIIHAGIYLCLSFWLLHQHNEHIKQVFSYTEKINLQWLKRLLLGMMTIYSIWFITELLRFDIQTYIILDTTLGLSIVLLIYSMGLLGLRQPQIFSHHILDHDKEPLENKESTVEHKYQNSPVSYDLSEALMIELKDYLQKSAVYLDAKLSLPLLAEQLKTPVHYLSQEINEQSGSNFFDFINRYRVDEAKRQLIENKDKKILVIALDSGFSSKSTFYTAFKKHTKMTPSEYRKKGTD